MTPSAPIRVGLVGAGTHARGWHAPMWAAGPETILSSVWARRSEASLSLAADYGAQPRWSFPELLDSCNAVAFAIPPHTQWRLALQAANAGKHLILEKPVADTADHARQLAAAVERAQVGTMVMLTARYAPEVRAFLSQAGHVDLIGARSAMLSDALLRTSYAQSPWRHEHGALLDLGPHIFDLVTAVLGQVTRVSATASSRGWIGVHLEHRNGAASEVVLSCHVGGNRSHWTMELIGSRGVLNLDVHKALDLSAVADTIRSDLVGVANGQSHPCDLRRGLYLQQIIEAVELATTKTPVSIAIEESG